MSIEETFAKSEKTDAILLIKQSGKIHNLHVNKALLSYHSDYFKKLFETDSGNEFPIEVNSLNVFAVALSQIQNNPMKFEYWDYDRIVGMIDEFQLPAAKRHLELFLISQEYHPKEMIKTADKFKMNELMKHSLSLMDERYVFHSFDHNSVSDETAVLLFNRYLEIMHRYNPSKPFPKPDYNTIFAKTDETDAILVVDGKKLHVNKAVLSYYSDYFKTLFESEFKEKSMDEIEIKDVNFEAFASFLSLVLKDPIMPTVNNAVKLLELADRFLLPAARRPVEFFLLSASIGTLNKIRVAEMFQLEDLLEQAINNCREIVEKENFLADPTFQLISTATKARMLH